jgi:hypothetical protein
MTSTDRAFVNHLAGLIAVKHVPRRPLTKRARKALAADIAEAIRVCVEAKTRGRRDGR